jgi:hypothetical protein
MNDGLNASRADVVGIANLSGDQRTLNRWFNTAAFVNPPNFIFGNSGVNILDGPGLALWDMAIQKLFSIREGMTLQFRGEAANLLNHVNLGQPSSTIGGSAYGAIRSLSSDPRNLQVSLRLQF